MAREAITPAFGYDGAIVLGGAICYLDMWDIDVQIDNESYVTFGDTLTPQGTAFKRVILGFTEGSANVSGKFDTRAGKVLPTDKSVWVGNSGAGLLAYSYNYTADTGIGYAIDYVIIGVGGAHNAQAIADASKFTAKLKLTSAYFDDSWVLGA